MAFIAEAVPTFLVGQLSFRYVSQLIETGL